MSCLPLFCTYEVVSKLYFEVVQIYTIYFVHFVEHSQAVFCMMVPGTVFILSAGVAVS